jgi:hypothetical protein
LYSGQVIYRIKGIFLLNDIKEGLISMKSSFILLIALCICVSTAWTAPIAIKSDADAQKKTSFDQFYDRLRIGYFGIFTSPHLADVYRGYVRAAATSPETAQGKVGEKQNRDTAPTNFWNQLSFRYTTGAKLDFVINPRFSINLADGAKGETTEVISMDDFLVGFQGVIYSSTDKKFNIWIRPGVRLPTSHASRTSNNAGFGKITYQPELAYLPTYDFNKKWQVGVFGQFRSWIYDNRYNISRFRFYTAPFIQYTFNETTRFQWYYENLIENNKRLESINGKKPVFKDYVQDFMIGINHDVNQKLNVFPYLGVFIDDPHFSSKSFFLGAWISYQIK